MTDQALDDEWIAPNDDSYGVKKVREIKEVPTKKRYVRGHMCPKSTADRISMEAGYNTHTVLNAVPQLQWQNNGIWKKLEKDCNEWADTYQSVWVVCGPVFFDKNPSVWLGQASEVQVAVPDTLYKIVIREGQNGIETLAFLIPNIIPKSKKDYTEYLTSIGRLEQLTGLSFLTTLSEKDRLPNLSNHQELTNTQKKAQVGKW
jgi:DNA/RNA endonuclease G (NUC1)